MIGVAQALGQETAAEFVSDKAAAHSDLGVD